MTKKELELEVKLLKERVQRLETELASHRGTDHSPVYVPYYPYYHYTPYKYPGYEPPWADNIRTTGQSSDAWRI